MSRLGRNPFDKAAPVQSETVKETKTPPRVTIRKPLTLSEKFAHFLQVDRPAEGFILGLKAALLLRSVWD
jgi:hypothetical protein